MQISYKAIRRFIHICGFSAFSGNDQRRSRFVDQNGVHLIDNGEIKLPLHHVFFVKHHVVPQIVKTVFVICTVSNIRVIGGFSFFFTDTVDHAAYRQAQEVIEFSHPLHISLCQIVVDCYNMDALAFQRVQIYRKRRHQRLTFTGFHLGDTSLVEYNTTDDLHTERLHSKTSYGCFPAYSKRFRQNIIQCLAIFQAFFELIRLISQLLIGHFLHLLVISLNFIRNFSNLLYLLRVQVAKNFFHETHFF